MSISFKNYRNLKIAVIATLFAGANLQAAELSVTDSAGVPYLRVDAAEGSKFDLNIQFNETKLNDAVDLKLTEKSGETRQLSVSSTDLSNGVSIQKVSLGEYVISTNSTDLQIKKVNVVDSNLAKSKDAAGDDSIGTTAYAVGAAALVGGAVAATAGSDGMDVFSGGSSNASTSRDGDVNSSAFTDQNFPRNNPGFGAAPTFIPTPTPTPFGGDVEQPANQPAGQPTPKPVPPIGQPMTPS